MRYPFLALIACIALAGCVLGNPGDLSRALGKPETELFTKVGTPDHQLTAPSGAKIDVYDQRSFNGQNVLCSMSFFIRDGVIVGISERGAAMNCGGSFGVVN